MTAKHNPTISIIFPAYNAEKFIEESIESILKQTYKDFEFIIIDDASTDATWDIIERFRRQDKRILAIKNKKNLKITATLNKGIGQAKGKYLARADADDWSYPNRLKKQLEFLEKHPEVGVVGGAMDIIDERGNYKGKREYFLKDEDIRKKIYRYSPFSHPTIMIRKEVLKKSGMYDQKYNFAEDYDLYFRIGKYAKFANLKDVLIKYRMTNQSITIRKAKEMEFKTIAIRKKYSGTKEFKMTQSDRLYNYLQYISIFIIPSSIKLWLFNKIRNSK